jgi:hypothetical protein
MTIRKDMNGGLFFIVAVSVWLPGLYLAEKYTMSSSWTFPIVSISAIIISAVICWAKNIRVLNWLAVVLFWLIIWPRSIWKCSRDRAFNWGIICMAAVPFFHTAIVWRHNEYTLVVAAQASLVLSAIAYLLGGIAINIYLINTEGVGFLELPKISEFKEGIADEC